MLTVSEIAETLKVSTRTVRLWIESGKLPAFKFGKDYRVNQSDFDNFISESKVSSVEATPEN